MIHKKLRRFFGTGKARNSKGTACFGLWKRAALAWTTLPCRLFAISAMIRRGLALFLRVPPDPPGGDAAMCGCGAAGEGRARAQDVHGRSGSVTPEAGTRVMAKFVPDDVPAWKTELTEKLAASRVRRSGRLTSQPRLPLEHPSLDSAEESGRPNVAAAVAARYAGRPSYREVLEREAEEAALAAEQALVEAQAAQEAVRCRMEDARVAEAAAAEAREAEERLCAEQERVERESIEVRYDVDERTRRQMQAYESRRSVRLPQPAHAAVPPQMTQFSDPLEEETVAPAISLAANLIEFPRELVAARKRVHGWPRGRCAIRSRRAASCASSKWNRRRSIAVRGQRLLLVGWIGRRSG